MRLLASDLKSVKRNVILQVLFPAAFTVYCLRRRRSKPSVYSVCELVQNIVFEPRRVARTYVDVFDWLVSYAVCD